MEALLYLIYAGFVDIFGFLTFCTNWWRRIILIYGLHVKSHSHGKATRLKVRSVNSERLRAPCLGARHVVRVRMHVGRHCDEAGYKRASGDRLVGLPKAYEE